MLATFRAILNSRADKGRIDSPTNGHKGALSSCSGVIRATRRASGTQTSPPCLTREELGPDVLLTGALKSERTPLTNNMDIHRMLRVGIRFPATPV